MPLGGDWETRQMRDYAVGAEVGPGVEYERTQPVAQMGVKSYVVTPLAWSFVAALLLALGASVVVVLSLGSRMPLPLWSPVVVFIVVLILAWFSRSDIATKLLYVTERIRGQDLNGDDREGEPQRLELEITERRPGGGTMHFIEVDGVDEPTLKAWAAGVARGQSLAVHRWSGAGQPFSQPSYIRFMDQMQTMGLVVNYGGNRGFELTHSGKAVAKKLAE